MSELESEIYLKCKEVDLSHAQTQTAGFLDVTTEIYSKGTT